MDAPVPTSKQKKSIVNPRHKLIQDLIEDIQTEIIMKSQIMVMGDFNEDLKDNDDDGIKSLMESTFLVQIFQQLKKHGPEHKRQ